MGRVFVIGDIHGCYKTFRKLLFDHCKIQSPDRIFLLGDYVDRGPQSKEVIDLIMELMKKGYKIFPLMGNHERMFLDSMDSVVSFSQWSVNGCKSTLQSFGISHPEYLEKPYRDFLENLEYYYIHEKFVIVHGGLNFDIDDPLSDRTSMVWKRNEYVDKLKIGGRRLIVGHTPTPLEKIKKSLNEDKIMLDGGCIYHGSYQEIGYLCALELNSMKLLTQANIDLV